MAIKSYKTPPPPKQTPALVLHIRASLLPPALWPHKEAKCCVQQLEPRVLLVPHRRSCGGPVQTASQGGGVLTLKGAICWDKGGHLGSQRTHTALILCSWLQENWLKACKRGLTPRPVSFTWKDEHRLYSWEWDSGGDTIWWPPCGLTEGRSIKESVN